MMREIKFAYYWAESKNKTIREIITLHELERCLREHENGLNIWPPIARCQYTGLKDKNGVEIYEGDIIAFGDDDISEPRVGMYGEVGHVVYDYDSAKYVVVLCKSSRNVNLAEHLLFSDRHTCRVVIGNIHQHPHLLEI